MGVDEIIKRIEEQGEKLFKKKEAGEKE